jgi:predicted nucleotidyltransferase
MPAASRSPTSRIDRLVAARTEARARTARGRATALLAGLKARGYDVAVIGSLAAGRFRLHSDIDLLVRNPVDGAGRAEVERAVAEALRASGIPYDLIFACDLTASQREAFEHDLVVSPGLR